MLRPNWSGKRLLISVAMLLALSQVAAHGQALTVTHTVPSQTPPLSPVHGTATFNQLFFNNHSVVSNWVEGGMRFSSPPGIYGWGNTFIPPGFTDQNFYYDAGVFDRYRVRREDGQAFGALQFDTANTGGGVWNYIWMTVRRGGQTLGTYDLDIQMQFTTTVTNRITIRGDFDEVLLFSNSDKPLRDAHPSPSAAVMNQLAIDNVTYTQLPEPGSAVAVMATLVIAAVHRRRSARARRRI